ncbi:MAG: SMP-30/gluconolactonase/LRE family protein [Gammaproteobacteria bacterium]|nr:SMP-30/gluconolactonase/LRE family protein [Gammaproteobacteria bacterium]
MRVNALEANTLDDGLNAVIEAGASFEQIATGFNFVEGPAWNLTHNCLVFSDITGDAMYRWSASDGVNVFRKPSHMANGTTWDQQGRLVVCEHAGSRVSRVSVDGKYQVLASHYAGKELNSPNDVVVSRQGHVLFTDPNSGRGAAFGVEREQELGFQGVYQLDPDSGELKLLVDDFAKPNGLCFSRDEFRLFINDTDRQHIRVFDVRQNGGLSDGRVWASVDGEQAGVADGMKLDSAGNLYCCGSGGIHVFDPDANLLGVIPTPEFAANFAWGGENLTDLLVTATHSVYRLRVKIPGFNPLKPQPDVAE